MPKISIAHSPDADDAFMFYALTQGKIPADGVEIENVLVDIETLNRAALKGKYDFTALSVAAYPYVCNRYLISPVGASVGENYGPTVVSRELMSIGALRQIKIAVPGERTTAFLALKLFLGDFSYEVVPFDQIIPQILDGKWDAGLIIHEGQVSYLRQKLYKILDLGEWWFQKTGLPLPLGVNVIKKDLPTDLARQTLSLLSRSIEYALENRREALQYALRYSRSLPAHLGDKFVGMYVNRHTVRMDPDAIKAIELLLGQGYTRGVFPKPVKPEFLI